MYLTGDGLLYGETSVAAIAPFDPVAMVNGVPVSVEDLMAHLAMEIAAGLMTDIELRNYYCIQKPTWDRLVNNPYFQKMVADAASEISGETNSAKRIVMKARLALEDSIGTIYSMIHTKDTPAAARIEGFKQLARVAGMDQPESSKAQGNGFQINITIGGGQTVTVSSAVTRESDDGHEITAEYYEEDWSEDLPKKPMDPYVFAANMEIGVVFTDGTRSDE